LPHTPRVETRIVRKKGNEMKIAIFLLSAIALITSASAQQANPKPTTDQIKKAFLICNQHRVLPRDNPKFAYTPDPRNKNWHESWEFCSEIQDQYELDEQNEAASRVDSEKNAINDLATKLKK